MQRKRGNDIVIALTSRFPPLKLWRTPASCGVVRLGGGNKIFFDDAYLRIIFTRFPRVSTTAGLLSTPQSGPRNPGRVPSPQCAWEVGAAGPPIDNPDPLPRGP